MTIGRYLRAFLRLPSLEEARRWSESDEYKEIAKRRWRRLP